MSLIKPDFRVTIAETLIDEVFLRSSKFYYFLGKIEDWTTDTPPATENTLADETQVRNNLLYLKQIGSTDVSLATYHTPWETDVVFDQWDDTLEMEGLYFFCTNSEFNVYKCLDNGSGNPSTVEPTGTLLVPFRTSDGYLWKYMFNIPTFKRKKFLSRGYMPVQLATTDTFYNKGAVEQVTVLEPGDGYVTVQLTNIVVEDTRTGSGAAAEISEVGTNGEIVSLSVLSGGTGYINEPNGATVTITSNTGSGAVITIQATDGVITGFTVVNAGGGYNIEDSIDISTESANIIPIISRTTGAIVDILIINQGSGYASLPELTIVHDPETGSGIYGNNTAVLRPILYQGAIVNVTIEDPGQDYPTDTSTSIVVQGDGIGAVFSPVIVDGQLIGVIVENSGSDYTFINIEIVGQGVGARAQPILRQSDFESDQSVVEQTAIPGAIYSVKMTNSGNNYSSATVVTITGDGTGATAIPVIDNTGGITHVIVTSFGSGYTTASVTFTDALRITTPQTVEADGYVVLPPYKGHGFNSVKELFGNVVSVYTLLQGDEELTMIQQDYRQYGVIKNPLDLISRRRLSPVTDFVSFSITITNESTIEPDDVLINQSTRYRVVSRELNVIRVQQLSAQYITPAGLFIREDDPLTEYNIIRVDRAPTADKYTGDLLYVTNSTPFTPTTEQVIAIRTYIKM